MGGELHPDGARTIPATALDLASFPDAQRQLADLSAPLLRDSDVPGHRLFVAAFDGTGNSMFKDAPANHTNVADVAKQIDALKDPTIGFGYVEGPGTQGGLGGLGDIMTGDSYRARMDEMYVQFVRQADAGLKENPNADIRIAAIGFSRGAEQAAGFTRLIEERGIQDPAGMNVVRKTASSSGSSSRARPCANPAPSSRPSACSIRWAPVSRATMIAGCRPRWCRDSRSPPKTNDATCSSPRACWIPA